jgi:hypothetical protein
MRSGKFLVAAAAVVMLAGAGCLLTSGQILISFDDFTNPFTVNMTMDVHRQAVDLNTIGDYNDHKDKLESLADIALLGQITNNSTTAVDVEAYFTETATMFTTAAQVRSAAKKLWGAFALAPSETKTIGWDESAGLIDDAGRDALIADIQGDGVFTIYVIAATGTYNFTVNNPVLVLVLDAGV